MKLRYCVLFAFILSTALMAADVNWTGPITVTPANPSVGDHVTIKARVSVLNGNLDNLTVAGKIDGNTVYSNTFTNITAPKTLIITVNWTAAHTTKMARLQGQPSNVKVEFSFSSTSPVNTNANSIEAVIPVKDAQPTLNQGQNITQQTPKMDLGPCYENQNATTDLIPTEFSFNYTKFGKFSYKVSLKNTGPRCVKSFHYKITYLLNGVETVYKTFELPAGADGWALKANETRTITRTFDRHELPYQAFQTSIDSSVQEISFNFVLKLTIDSDNEVSETNEMNNVIEKNLSWIED